MLQMSVTPIFPYIFNAIIITLL